MTATETKQRIDEAVKAERKRCYDIVMAARIHEIDTDFRVLLHLIESGDSVDDLKQRRKL